MNSTQTIYALDKEEEEEESDQQKNCKKAMSCRQSLMNSAQTIYAIDTKKCQTSINLLTFLVTFIDFVKAASFRYSFGNNNNRSTTKTTTATPSEQNFTLSDVNIDRPIPGKGNGCININNDDGDDVNTCETIFQSRMQQHQQQQQRIYTTTTEEKIASRFFVSFQEQKGSTWGGVEGGSNHPSTLCVRSGRAGGVAAAAEDDKEEEEAFDAAMTLFCAAQLLFALHNPRPQCPAQPTTTEGSSAPKFLHTHDVLFNNAQTNACEASILPEKTCEF